MNNIMAGITNILVGLLIIVLSIPLTKRKIKMNRWYGVKIPKSFESDDNWYKINEYGGKIFIYWSIPIVLIGIISLFLPPLRDKGIIILSLVPLLVLLRTTIQLLIYSKKL